VNVQKHLNIWKFCSKLLLFFLWFKYSKKIKVHVLFHSVHGSSMPNFHGVTPTLIALLDHVTPSSRRSFLLNHLLLNHLLLNHLLLNHLLLNHLLLNHPLLNHIRSGIILSPELVLSPEPHQIQTPLLISILIL
jgi:hypothetical protein